MKKTERRERLMPNGTPRLARRWMVYCRTPSGTRVEVQIDADYEVNAMLAAPMALDKGYPRFYGCTAEYALPIGTPVEPRDE